MTGFPNGVQEIRDGLFTVLQNVTGQAGYPIYANSHGEYLFFYEEYLDW